MREVREIESTRHVAEGFVSRAINLDAAARTLTHVVSSARLDRSNRIIDQSGWKLANYRKAPRVLLDHDYRVASIIGKASATGVVDGELVSTTQFAESQLGDFALAMIQAGMVNTWSVGWRGLKAHYSDSEAGADCPVCQDVVEKKKARWALHFLDSELLEYSLVSVPANPDAVMGLRHAGLKIDVGAVEEWNEIARVRYPDLDPKTVGLGAATLIDYDAAHEKGDVLCEVHESAGSDSASADAPTGAAAGPAIVEPPERSAEFWDELLRRKASDARRATAMEEVLRRNERN